MKSVIKLDMKSDISLDIKSDIKSDKKSDKKIGQNIRHQAWVIRHRTPDIGHGTTDRTSIRSSNRTKRSDKKIGQKSQTSQTSDIRHKTLDYQTSNIGQQNRKSNITASDIGHETSDYPTSNIGHR